jgi:hypothetical protein
MKRWFVVAVNAGCDCCSFVDVADFDTEAEAIAFVNGDDNYIIDEVEQEYLNPDFQENVNNNGHKEG